MHCFTNFDIVYQATNEGPYGKRHEREQPSTDAIPMHEWLAQLPMEVGKKMSTECAGEIKEAAAAADSSSSTGSSLQGAEVPGYTYVFCSVFFLSFLVVCLSLSLSPIHLLLPACIL
jgi:hypothetical protein